MSETREELEARAEKLEKELEKLRLRSAYREKDELTMSLLKQPTMLLSSAADAFEEFDVHLTDGPAFVIAVDFCHRGMVPPDREMAFALFLAKNMVDDLFGQDYLVLNTREGSVYYGVVCVKPEHQPVRQEVLDACATIIRTLREEAGHNAIACVSGQRESITEVHLAWEEVEWLRHYLRFADEDGPVICCDFLQRTPVPDLTQQLRELQQDLQTRKYQDASQKAMEILDQLQFGKKLTPDGHERQLQRVMEPMLDQITESVWDGELDIAVGRELCRAMRQADSMEALRRAIRNAMQILAEGKTEQDQSVPGWMTLLMEKINTGYRNPQMSVNYLADQIGITAVHLSRVFRRVEGIGLMDYIHQLRVEDAKRLIMGGCSVKSAMSMVGYSNQLTMTRAFKRLEGSTPGQYSPAARISILTEDSSDLQQDLQI